MNSSPFLASVICPVYNAERFLRRAVASAVPLKTVGEVILVDDAGPDNSLAVCKELESEYSKVKLYQHPDGLNHGAGASRNLGIKHAKFEFIAFLDADDYYLSNRFEQEERIFGENSSIDGVYGAISIDYDSDDARNAFLNAGFGYQEFLTLTSEVPPEELVAVLFGLHPTVTGEFSTIGITVRKSLFKRCGFFNENLSLRQDIHLWRRMAAVGRLVAGSINKAIAVRGVHAANRMTNRSLKDNTSDYWWGDLNDWFRKTPGLPKYAKRVFSEAYCRYRVRNRPKWEARRAFLAFIVMNPGRLFEKMGFFDVFLFEAFGRNQLTLRLVSMKNRISRDF